MPGISIANLDGYTYEVTVHDKATTIHTVTVRPHYVRQLNAEGVPLSELLKHSFDFLLAREANTSILRSFDLTIISRYFPEYEGEMLKLLQK